MIKTWKRAITVIGKLESQGLELSQLIGVMNPIEAKRAKKLALGKADITEADLDLIETAMANLTPSEGFLVKPREKRTQQWIERIKNGAESR